MAIPQILCCVFLMGIGVFGESGRGESHSYHHQTAPVMGRHELVEWKNKYGDYDHNYKAHPHYKFSYGVRDHDHKNYHGHKEYRDGNKLSGEYHVQEPGGNVRTVKYHTDPEGGFFAEIHNDGGNDASDFESW